MENICKKPPTNFTIDCILSKSENQNVDYPRSPVNHPLNKVLDNNPWISKFPTALTFKPSTHRKLSFPLPQISPTPSNVFNFHRPSNYSENSVKVTQHFTSVHNHFYSHSTSSESTSNSDDFKLLPTFENLTDEKSPSDNEIAGDNLSLNLSGKVELSTTSNFPYKCSVCSKSFESCELLDVGWKLQVQENKLN